MADRTCSQCGVSKPETTDFFRRRGTKDRGGLRPECRECSNARDRQYYRNNADAFTEYRKVNAERIREYMREYEPRYYRTENGRRRRIAANSRWYTSASGRLKSALASQRRRARKASVPGVFTADDWSACVAAFDGTCAYCGRRTDLTQDHVAPILVGGANDPSNIVPACLSCNSGKCAKALADWYPLQPFFDEALMLRLLAYLEMIMSRIYVPEIDAADLEGSDAVAATEPVGQGRIYLPSSEPGAEKATAEDDNATELADDQGEGKSSETVTVTEPAEVKPGPPPPKKATAQRGKGQ